MSKKSCPLLEAYYSIEMNETSLTYSTILCASLLKNIMMEKARPKRKARIRPPLRGADPVLLVWIGSGLASSFKIPLQWNFSWSDGCTEIYLLCGFTSGAYIRSVRYPRNPLCPYRAFKNNASNNRGPGALDQLKPQGAVSWKST